MSTIVVRAPSRLHFGLLGWGPSHTRQFGGLGLMIEDVGLELELRPAERWRASGPLSDRALNSALQFAETLQQSLGWIAPGEIVVRKAPPEHVGLGVGTQLTLAIASALLTREGSVPITVQQLAALTGRGQRSGVGLHGFLQGGLLVDGGRAPESPFPPLLWRHDLPKDWYVLVAVPPSTQPVHGTLEQKAFAALPEVPSTHRDRLAALLLLGIIPAVVEQDLEAFGSALQEFQHFVGIVFAAAQGGLYADPSVAAVVRALVEAGLKGVGQSSWGPAVYGFSTATQEERQALLAQLQSWCGPKTMLFWTSANRRGASIVRL